MAGAFGPLSSLCWSSCRRSCSTRSTSSPRGWRTQDWLCRRGCHTRRSSTARVADVRRLEETSRDTHEEHVVAFKPPDESAALADGYEEGAGKQLRVLRESRLHERGDHERQDPNRSCPRRRPEPANAPAITQHGPVPAIGQRVALAASVRGSDSTERPARCTACWFDSRSTHSLRVRRSCDDSFARTSELGPRPSSHCWPRHFA